MRGASTYHHQDKSLLKDFYVIGVISNPVRFKTRYALYQQFKKHMADSGVKLFTVELQLGDRAFQVTSAKDPMNLQLRSDHELWHKENMINLGISRLPKDWKYVAWIDCDVEFLNKDWALETVQQLQHYKFVQLFQNAIDLGPDGRVVQTHCGFNWCYLEGKPYGKSYTFWHPGYAHAATREALESTGLLLDTAVLGAADHHMQLALIGRGRDSFPGNISSDYARAVLRWEDRAAQYVKKSIGYIPGTILHYWHGKKKDRKYVERWDILVMNKFNPEVDLRRDWQGLLMLNENNVGLRDGIRQYFRVRNEDSVDLD